MSTSVLSAVHEAYGGSLIRVECCFLRGYVGVQLLGNTGEITKNGLERAKTALEEAKVILPQKKIVISLSPGEARKDGSQFDLAFAVALAFLVKHAKDEDVEDKTNQEPPPWLFVAELGLDGSLKPVKGVINYGIQASIAGLKGLVVAKENQEELYALQKMQKDYKEGPLEIRGFSTLKEVLAWLDSQDSWQEDTNLEAKTQEPEQKMNFDDMVLDPSLKKIAMMVSLGQHNLLLAGTPGCGKSMFIQRLPSLLPKMPQNIHKEALVHYSLVHHKIPEELLWGQPPLRMPHHQASPQAILGSAHQPGELALAHGGILFLDEFCEFRRDIIEGLREPLETGHVRVARAQHKVVWKAQAVLAVAFNNCPCGWYGSKVKKCYCPMPKVLSYLRKISGPILDRIDLHVNMPENLENPGRILKSGKTPQTQNMLEHLARAREFSSERMAFYGIQSNSQLKPYELSSALGLNQDELESLLATVIPKGATNRSVIRTLRVARTAADLDLCSKVQLDHVVFAWRFQSESAAKERGMGGFT